VLHPDHLTIGFSRRFAGYKRATLLLSDPDRLARLLNRAERPVQMVFAGKAHPHDEPGKELIRELVNMTNRPELRSRIAFIVDYDLNVARHLVQGCDVWLNTPRRPFEASGTSGMKAIANGGLHLSTLDGWWDEAFEPGIGWAIGDRRDYADPGEQDVVDRSTLYDLLEEEIVPLFYERDAGGLPRAWIQMMRASMDALTDRFSTQRMVSEYDERFYRPGTALAARLSEGGTGPARRLAQWWERIDKAWPAVRVDRLRSDRGDLSVGHATRVEVLVELAGLSPGDVKVDLLLGSVEADGELSLHQALTLEPAGTVAGGLRRYRSDSIPLAETGTYGLLARITPRHPDLLEVQSLARARYGP
jgi:starch phosphorylase